MFEELLLSETIPPRHDLASSQPKHVNGSGLGTDSSVKDPELGTVLL